MQIQDYTSFGGVHADTAALRNALAHAGVLDPRTAGPLTEAAVFGISGGIGIGYGFCPSVPRHGAGGGVAVIARHGATSYEGAYQRAVFERIGVAHAVEEASTPKAAQNKLLRLLGDGQPVVVQCAQRLSYHGGDLGGACATSSWSVVVHGIDEDKDEVSIADLPSSSMVTSLASLARARNAVCTHKNRMIVLAPAKQKLTAANLKRAFVAGLQACVRSLLEPRMKTCSLEGLFRLPKMMINDKNKAGWLKVYDGGRMYWPLRDLFMSVEINTGGGLMRPMFADFLEEAAVVVKKKALSDCAEEYRGIGVAWTEFADTALPTKAAPLKKTKSLLRKREATWRDKGARGRQAYLNATDELSKIEREQLKKLAMPRAAVVDLLHGLSGRIEDLHARETTAIEGLAKAIA